LRFFKRLFGASSPAELAPVSTRREYDAEAMRDRAAVDCVQLVEVDISGVRFHQAELAQLAGPEGPDGKRDLVDVTLRCEPENQYDSNAIRVEARGRLLGHVARDQAAVLSAPMSRVCGGIVEARGLIDGGWRTATRDELGQIFVKDEGIFGIRVWLTKHDAECLGVHPSDIDWSLRPPWPELPVIGTRETRLSPTEAETAAGRTCSQVTVVAEEHYQATILAAQPLDWGNRKWPLLVDLVSDVENPYAKKQSACIGVCIGDSPVGFFTPTMSKRHGPEIADARSRGERVTASATASLGKKGGTTFWRIKVAIRRQ
jgi:hypothetical protein